MKYRIQHLTSYHYSEEVDLGPHIVRLRPAVHAKSKVLSYSLTVKPDCQIRWQYDPWNNLIARLAFPPDRKFQELSLCVDATVEIKPINPFDFYVESWCEQLPFDYPEAVQKELLPFLEKPEGGALFNEFIKKFPLEGALIDFLVNLNATVSRRFLMKSGMSQAFRPAKRPWLAEPAPVEIRRSSPWRYCVHSGSLPAL